MKNKSLFAHWFWGLFCLMGLSVSTLRAETDPKFYAVMVSAQVQSSPAQITLRWGSDGNATGYSISRKPKGNGSWSTVANVGGSTTSWTDTGVSNGGVYEYRVTKSTTVGYRGTGYLLAGINAPLVDTRGKVVLLVDSTYAADLSTELKRLEWDLAGDGWTVLRHDVSRSLTPPQVKNIIKGDYNSDPGNVKAVFIFGHIAVPYSGNFRPDGHPDHEGAWAADAYYGDMDGNWSDSSVNNGSAQRPANRNIPGDGKFDQSELPSNVELAVGRVDFYNMTCYANKAQSRSERDLLRQYLNKDHNFRHRVFTVARRGLVCDNFGERSGEAFASSGWRNFGAFFGAENVTAVGGWQYFSTVASQDYLWSYGTGGGSYYTCNGIGSSDDFATTDIKSVFTMFLGSYFGDWDNESNFLRASLGSGYCLTTSWSGRPHWFYHHMGLGETIGYSTILSVNNGGGGLYENQVNYAARQVHASLLGDPTLRMHPVVPPSNLRGTASGSSMTLTWSGSSDSDVVGYHVYRGSGVNSGFTRLTSNPVNALSFTDSGYTAGSTYMVRTVKLERAGGGTYYNSSQGVFYPENGGGGSTGGTGGGTTGGGTVPVAPTALVATAASGSQANLVWVDTASNETGYRVERKQGVSGSWTQVAALGVNASSYNNTGLAPATQYFYRVSAYNSTGNSAFSNEASVTTASPNPVAAGAAFVRTDASTQGNWRGVYGKDGYVICGNVSSLPGYALMTPSGKADYEWSDSTTEARALQKPSGTGRIASCWYSTTGYTVDLNFTDGNTHQLGIYFMDWDRVGRSETVEILDAASGTVLNTQTVSDFAEGKYLLWNVKGAIKVRLTRNAGPNAVTMGLFFDPSSSGATGSGSSGALVNGKFQLRITGQAGQKFDIYASSDLKTWAPAATVTLTGTTYDYVDSSSNTPVRFYRAVAAP